MAITDVDLCNMALGRLGTKSTLASLTDGSAEAAACNLYLAPAIDQCLEARDWRFARRSILLQPEASSLNPSWAYEFVKPDVCSKVQHVLDTAVSASSYDHRLDFDQQGTEYDEGWNGTARVVWAQVPGITIVCTDNSLTYDVWPNSFLQLVVYRLAADLALTLTGSGDVRDRMQDGFQAALATATAQDTPPDKMRRLQTGATFPDLTTDLGVVNAALFRSGSKTVLASLTDGSPIATAASSILQSVKQSVLSARPWRFARRAAPLVGLATSSNAMWPHEFNQPADCAYVLNVLDGSVAASSYDHRQDFERQGIEFEPGWNGTSSVVWAAQPSAAIVYTSNALAYTQWPGAFLQAVIWKLAAELGLSLTGDLEAQKTMLAAYQAEFDEAVKQDTPPENIRRLQSSAVIPDLTTDVGLVNAALYRAGAKTILATLTDGSPQATAASSILASVIASVLTVRPWRFARKAATVAASANSSNAVWAQEFQKPADCIYVENVVDASVAASSYDHRQDFMKQGVEFDEGFSGSSPVVWAQQASVAIIYTSNALTYAQWPSGFLQAVVWKLAATLALSWPEASANQKALTDGYEASLKEAVEQDTPPEAIRRLQTAATFPDLNSDVGIVNAALYRCGAKTVLASLTDGSPVATAASSILQTVKETALCLRSWRFARRGVTLTANAESSNPAWPYEFPVPADCLKVQSLVPVSRHAQGDLAGSPFQKTVPSGIGYSGASPVIWTRCQSFTLLYTTDSQTYAQWPSPFRDYVIWMLAAALAPSEVDIKTAAAMAEGAQQTLQAAVTQDSPHSVSSATYTPDWLAVRDDDWLEREYRPNPGEFGVQPSGYIVGDAAANSPTPAYLQPANSLNGVQNSGLQPVMIADRRNQYIPASTPDSRIGILTIGESPVSWRRPYHRTIELGADPGDGETEI